MLKRLSGKILTRLLCSDSFTSTNISTEVRKTSGVVVDELIFEYGNEKFIRKIFSTNVNLENSDFALWKNFINALKPYGFELQDCFNMISKQPELLHLNEEQVKQRVEEWQIRSTLGLDKLVFLLSNQPIFLNLEESTLKNRIPYLMAYCTARNSMMNLLLLCPNLMFEHWDDVLKKIHFLNDEVVVFRAEVLKCRALSKSLEHIQLRFQVLQGCGLYIVPSPYPHKQTKKERLKLMNPHLTRITDTNDYEFAKKVAKITLEEYNVFSEIFKLKNGGNASVDGYETDECD